MSHYPANPLISLVNPLILTFSRANNDSGSHYGECQGKEDVNFTMEVVRSYNEPLDRQIMEKVQISNFKGAVLMNRRNEMGGVRVERTQYRRWGGN